MVGHGRRTHFQGGVKLVYELVPVLHVSQGFVCLVWFFLDVLRVTHSSAVPQTGSGPSSEGGWIAS